MPERMNYAPDRMQNMCMVEEPVGDRMAEESFCFIVITTKGGMRLDYFLS